MGDRGCTLPAITRRCTPVRRILALVGLALVAVLTGHAAARAANFVVDPPAGSPGSSLTGSGDGYRNCFADFYIQFDDPQVDSPHQPPDSTTPDARSATLIVPSGAAPGDHVIRAFCGDVEVDSGKFQVVAPATTTTGPPTTPAPPTTTTTSTTPEPPETTRPTGTTLRTTTTRPTSTTARLVVDVSDPSAPSTTPPRGPSTRPPRPSPPSPRTGPVRTSRRGALHQRHGLRRL